MSHPPPRRVHAITIPAAPYLVAVVCALLIAVSACGGDDPAPQQAAAQQESAPPAAEPEPVAQQVRDEAAPPAAAERPRREARDPLLIQIAQAAALERNGYWIEAAELRQDALEDASLAGLIGGAAVDQLTLDQVRLLLRLGRPADAERMLSGMRAQVLPLEAGRRHALLSAALSLALDETGPAVDAIERYAALDGPASGAVLLEAAERLSAAGSASAAEFAERALEDEMLPLASRRRVLWLLARALDDAGEVEAARERFEQFYAISFYQDDQVYALSRIAALAAQTGDQDTAVSVWRLLVSDHPQYSASWEALDELRAAGAEVDELTAVSALIEAGRYDEARGAMLTVLGASDDGGELAAAEFYIADIHQRQENASSANLGYEAVIGRDASHPLAAESLMRLAEFAWDNGDEAGAEQRWERVVREYPSRAQAQTAAWRWSWAAVVRGEWETAAQRLLDAAALAGDGATLETRQRWLFWSALAAARAGAVAEAAERAQSVIELASERYYGLRAALLIEDGWPAVPVVEDTAAWLAEQTDTQPSDWPQELELDPRWSAARDLRQGGFDRAADAQLGQWVGDWASEPGLLYALARFLHAQGETSAGARAGTALLRALELSWPEAPAAIVALAYPRPWPELLGQVEERDGVDPLLLWALIRRESFYDPNARGLAGEVGLTQVIPATGGDIASGLGLEEYEHEDLARPQLAIRFGAAYLGWQLESFDQRQTIALAAYNAGPGNASRWLEAAEALSMPSMLESAFLGVMDFPSTQAYVRYVIESWAAYWALAALERTP